MRDQNWRSGKRARLEEGNRSGKRTEGTGMKKRKKDVFSATKAVKALARERVGQPKASRVIVPKAKVEREPGAEAARGAKHKEKLETLIEREE